MTRSISLSDTLQKIDALKVRLDAKRPLNTGELTELKKTLKVDFTYNSNAIEGNTLTHGETKIVLEEGLTIAGKTVREITEATNHHAMFDWLWSMIDQSAEITEENILALHALVLNGIDEENAGRYRDIQVRISGDEAPLPPASNVHLLMQELLQWCVENKESLHRVQLAAEFHYRFVKIHPFVDGNGRTVRILMNVLLMQKGYPLTTIPVIRRADYISVLHSTKTQEDFLNFFVSVAYENMKDYLRMIDPEVT
jgi:Fic family protein